MFIEIKSGSGCACFHNSCYNKICTFLGIEHFDESQRFDKVFVGNYNSEIETSTIDYLKPKFANDVTAIQDLYPHLDYSSWYDYS